MANFHQFLEKIRNSDESTKKRWLFIMSGLSMVIIIALWLVFQNHLLKTANEKPTKSSEITFWQIFKNGLKITGISLQEKSRWLIYKIIGKNVIIIE